MGNTFGSDPIIKPIRATNVDFLKFNNKYLINFEKNIIPIIKIYNLYWNKIDEQQSNNILIDNNVDTIVLGCTHYSFLIPTIKKLVPKKIKILDSTKAVVNHTKNVLYKESVLTKNLWKGQVSFYSTGKIKMNIWKKFDIDNVSKIKI